MKKQFERRAYSSNGDFYSSASESAYAKSNGASVIIRRIANVGELEAVYRLTHRCYVSRGYAQNQANGLVVHFPEYDALSDTSVFVAIKDSRIIGSVSLTLAGSMGCPISQDFASELEALQKNNRKVGVMWRLVVDESEKESRYVFLSLIREARLRWAAARMDTLLVIVEREQERLYHRLLNMTTIGQKDHSLVLNDLSVSLLRCDAETLPGDWKSAELIIHSHEALAFTLLMPSAKPSIHPSR